MPTLHIKGGTLCVNGVFFFEGETAIPEDAVTVEAVEKACEELRWARVSYEDESVKADPAPEGAPAVELGEDGQTAEPALPVAGERTVASDEHDEAEAARAERLAELVENDGEPKAEKPAGPECGDCGKTFKNEAGLATHRRLKHPAPDAD